MTICDSSVIIDFIRHKDKTTTWLYELTNQEHDLAISIIALTEIYSGKSVWEKSEALKEVEAILEDLQVIPISSEIAKSAGKTRSQLDTNAIDAIIAQTAISLDSPLATLNTKHFSHIPHLQLLSR